jgi:hypothetical protein
MTCRRAATEHRPDVMSPCTRGGYRRTVAGEYQPGVHATVVTLPAPVARGSSAATMFRPLGCRPAAFSFQPPPATRPHTTPLASSKSERRRGGTRRSRFTRYRPRVTHLTGQRAGSRSIRARGRLAQGTRDTTDMRPIRAHNIERPPVCSSAPGQNPRSHWARRRCRSDHSRRCQARRRAPRFPSKLLKGWRDCRSRPICSSAPAHASSQLLLGDASGGSTAIALTAHGQ